jgi:hypothetical protein
VLLTLPLRARLRKGIPEGQAKLLSQANAAKIIAMDKDESDLKLLSILFFVMSGFAALGGSVPVLHAVIGVMMLRDPKGLAGPGGPPINPGYFFLGFGLVFIVIGWTIAFLLVLSGLSLRNKTRYWLCFVMACILCLQFPLGTALGVFTLIVLSRPSVKQLFGT